MISRRQLLLSVASTLLLPVMVRAGSTVDQKLSWTLFHEKMEALSEAEASGVLNHQAVAEQGLQILTQLDIHSASFRKAVDESYESGNRYWLWQRMSKGRNLNGGILNIDSDEIVQLHDHPGATGMVRIISGEAEAWQFDEVSNRGRVAELRCVTHSILRPGDTAVLTPDKGNIHALRSVSKECRMLDFFIPPYESSERSWFEPLNKNWFGEKTISCQKIPQYAYTKA